MSEKETAPEVDATKKVVEPEVEVKEPVEEPKPTEESPSKEEIDYEAIKEEEEKRVGKPDPEKAKEAFKKREEKRDEKIEVGPEDKPLTESRLIELLASERAETSKVMNENRALEIARANTSSEAEAQAALTFYKTRVIPTGNLNEDVVGAIGMVNSKKLISQNSELKRALGNKDNISNNSASTHRDSIQASEPKLSAADATAYKQAGFIWDGIKRIHKKQLGGPKGTKFLYKDFKTQKSWVE